MKYALFVAVKYEFGRRKSQFPNQNKRRGHIYVILQFYTNTLSHCFKDAALTFSFYQPIYNVGQNTSKTSRSK